MPTQPTPTTLPDLLRFYLRGLLDPHSFNTHLLLILIDQAMETLYTTVTNNFRFLP